MIDDIKILSTLGPSTLFPKIIQKLDKMGVDIFRINLSHTPMEEVEKTIEKIVQAKKINLIPIFPSRSNNSRAA